MNKQEIKQKWEKALALTKTYTTDKFKFYGNNEKVTISSAEASEGTVVKGEIIVENCKAREYMNVVCSTDMPTRLKLDPKTKAFSELETFEDEDGRWSIRYYLVASPSMMVSDRDFLYCEREFQEGNKLVLLTTSVDGSYTCDKASGVRGTNIFTLYELVELENGDLKVTFMGQANPNGWIPTAVSNQVVYERPLVISAAAKILNKNTKSVQ
ncbi:hypothetical protein C9374_000803 [Naegleria lovaniensis]|uniref:START domain-containing protein n=1 Tax=Naegleria lovaniensis TaxID=51637 RepID=A0AA88KMU7_NAELO|nr:uncharacterized protein C9374_000803 [Naegleria lovaniensis]KAG2387953.1 hypothetical protein C9374_000803 [Naegleria lovaniensis]